MDDFGAFDEEQFEALANSMVAEMGDSDADDIAEDMCPDCLIAMDWNHNQWICKTCGNTTTASGDQNECELSEIEVTQISIVHGGKTKGRIQDDGEKMRKKQQNIENEYRRLNNMSEYKMTPEIIAYAAQFFLSIQHGKIWRKNRYRAVLSAALYYSCMHFHADRTPKEIAKFMQLDRTGISPGRIIVDENASNHGVAIPVKEPEDFKNLLSRYVELLELPGDFPYVDAAHEIIMATVNACISLNSLLPSRCAGTLVWMARRRGLTVVDSDVEKKCEILKTTYNKFINAINKYRDDIAEVLQKYGL